MKTSTLHSLVSSLVLALMILLLPHDPAVAQTFVRLNGGATYTTISNAYAAIQTPITSPQVIELLAGYTGAAENYPIVFTAKAGASATNTITIRPAVSGLAITSNNATGTIRIDSGRYLIFDGRVGGTGSTKDLVIENTSTTGSAIRFGGGSSYNTLKYCIVKSACTAAASGTIAFITTGASGANYNTIDNCNIRDGVGTPTNGIYAQGGTGVNASRNNIVSNCHIFNFFHPTVNHSGIFVDAFDVQISGNSFYQTVSRNLTGAGNVWSGISVAGANGGAINVTGNWVGGQQPNAGGGAMLLTGSGVCRPIRWGTVDSVHTVSIQGNTIRNISITSTSSLVQAMIYSEGLTGGVSSRIAIEDNTIGPNITGGASSGTLCGILAGFVIPDTLYNPIWILNNDVIGFSHDVGKSWEDMKGIWIAGSDTGAIITIENNTIGSATAGFNTNGTLTGIYSSSSAQNQTVSGNTIRNLVSSSTFSGSTPTIAGLLLSPAPNITPRFVNIVQNTVQDLHSTTTAAANVKVAGITVDEPGAPPGRIRSLSQNRIFNLSTIATGASPRLIGIQSIVPGGCSDSITKPIYNNQITITNGTNVNNVEISGIRIDSSSANCPSHVMFNTVYIGGSVASGSLNTACITTTPTTGNDVVNNIFYNARTGGSGKHYAIRNLASPPSAGWSSTTSNYNLLIAPDSNSVCEWGAGVSKSFSGWKTASGGDANSWSVSGTLPTGMFVSVANGDLTLNASSPSVWYANGKGIPITGMADDFSAANVRSTAISTGPVDIGSSEITPTSMPPAPTVNGSVGQGNTQTFTFAGRTLGSIKWNSISGGTPALNFFRYHSGTLPPGALSGKYSKAYWDIAFNLNNAVVSYDLTLYYDPAIRYSIAAEPNIRIAKRNNADPWLHFPNALVDTTAKTVTLAGLTSFSQFTLSDNLNPLPVRLVSFTASRAHSGVMLEWTTEAESGNAGFSIQRSTETDDWSEIGFVSADRNGRSLNRYIFIDYNPQPSAVLRYRLKMADTDGSFEYSPIAALVSGATPAGLTLDSYPNPLAAGDQNSVIRFTLPQTDDVRLSVVDYSGREVALIVDGRIYAGSHHATFTPGALPAGVYYYALRSLSGTIVAKWVLRR